MRRISTKAELDRELEEAGDRLVAVNFTCEWAPQCESMLPRIQAVMSDPEFSEVIFLEVDVDDNEETAKACDIDFPPTVHLYRFGTKVDAVRQDGMDRLKAVFQLHR